MRKLSIGAIVLGFMLAVSQQTVNATNDKSVDVRGLRKAPLTKTPNIPKIKYNNTQPVPGSVKPLNKSFVTAPPQIPHSTEGLVPITIKNNACLNCHMPKNAKAMKMTAIPSDHLEKGKIKGSRYNCTQCHAPQADVNPVIENKFESLK